MSVVEADRADVQHVRWDSHKNWLRDHFEPGQHITVLNPTGGGKSFLAVEGILKLPAARQSRVLFVDSKGDDKVTRGFGVPISEWPPPRRMRLKRNAPQHYRLVVPEWEWSADPRRAASQIERARQIVGASLQRFYNSSADPSDAHAHPGTMASILVVDETYDLVNTQAPSLDLRSLIVHHLRKSRYRGLSLVLLSQNPLGLPADVYTQPTHFYIGPMLDKRYRERLREIGGNSPRIESVVARIKGHEFLFLGDKGRVMHIVMVGR